MSIVPPARSIRVGADDETDEAIGTAEIIGTIGIELVKLSTLNSELSISAMMASAHLDPQMPRRPGSTFRVQSLEFNIFQDVTEHPEARHGPAADRRVRRSANPGRTEGARARVRFGRRDSLCPQHRRTRA